MGTQTTTQQRSHSRKSTLHATNTPHNLAVGRHGEQLASEYLAKRGYSILARNWRCNDGELDIVALDGNTIVGVEVKTRTRKTHGAPYEAITWRKAARLRKLLAQWLRENKTHAPLIRIDAVSIVLSPTTQDHRLNTTKQRREHCGSCASSANHGEPQPEITHLRGIL